MNFTKCQETQDKIMELLQDHSKQEAWEIASNLLIELTRK
jgi:hypothetical protein